MFLQLYSTQYASTDCPLLSLDLVLEWIDYVFFSIKMNTAKTLTT